VVIATPRPIYCRERALVPIVQEVVWAPEPVYTDAENLAPPGFEPTNTQGVTILSTLSRPNSTCYERDKGINKEINRLRIYYSHVEPTVLEKWHIDAFFNFLKVGHTNACLWIRRMDVKKEVRRKEASQNFLRNVVGYRTVGNKHSAQTVCM